MRFISTFVLVLLFSTFFYSATTQNVKVNNNVVVHTKLPSIKLHNLEKVARVTGKSLPHEKFSNSNNTALDYDVYGTDLGIMWHMQGNKVGIFFGDTNGKGFQPSSGGGNVSDNWRSNVLAFSADTNLKDGLTIQSMVLDEDGKAREVVAGGKTNAQKYQTSIPTAAIRLNGVDYVHYMNIYDWTAPNCSWLTNFSSIAASYDDGQTWERKQEVTFDPMSHFSQVAYAKKDGMVYMIGTRSGRGDDAYLARFLEKDILNKKEYEYWNVNSKQWVKGDEESAAPVISGPVGEASLMYHKKYKTWILTHNYDYRCDKSEPIGKYLIVYRTAKDITDWSKPEILVSNQQYPGLYCAYLHPLNDNEDELYFLMSLWKPYNVFLMKVEIEDIGSF